MLSEKILKKVREMEVYFKIKGVKYGVNKLGEDSVFFAFEPFPPDKSLNITVTPVIVLDEDFINIIVTMDFDLDISKYNEILSIINENNNTSVKFRKPEDNRKYI